MIEVRSKPSVRGEFIAWGKWGRLETDCPLREPGEVWFDFADTAEEAEAKVRGEIEAAPRGHDGRPFFYPENTLPGALERLNDAFSGLGKSIKDAVSSIWGKSK